MQTYITLKSEKHPLIALENRMEQKSSNLPLLSLPFGIELDKSEMRLLLSVHSKVNFFTRPLTLVVR